MEDSLISWHARRMEFTERVIRTDGAEIAVAEAGEGRSVVVLHGLAGCRDEFIPTAEALADHRVVLVDLRGHGRSTRRPEDLSRAAFVADVVAVIESLGVAPVVLVGQSMGAHTAMLVAASRPDLVDCLVLLEGGAGGENGDESAALGDYFRSWPLPFADVAAARAFLGEGVLQEAWIAGLESAPDGLRPRFDADVMEATASAVAEPRWAEWEGVTTPTLVVFGEHGMFSEEQRAAFVDRGRSVIRLDLPGASHDAHLDAHDAWIAALRSAL
ncbi:alpha/beta hydrolase [Agromyces atrinae]|uniref:alpha/beta fold hydrolase n=1 Tax=Agromyces atrinae TaxID=592376 RepID=UPI001F58B358|nr:alpha/beta hydrolase [Agromyces atrinae]MCI2957666.1 alpha/beta hydrolase [Agromyces atrinae]